jgi:hypothetical protein
MSLGLGTITRMFNGVFEIMSCIACLYTVPAITAVWLIASQILRKISSLAYTRQSAMNNAG